MRRLLLLGVATCLVPPAFAFDPVNGSDFTASLTVEEGTVYLRDGTKWTDEDEEAVVEESCVPDSDCYIHLEDALYAKIMRGGIMWSYGNTTIVTKTMPASVEHAAQ